MIQQAPVQLDRAEIDQILQKDGEGTVIARAKAAKLANQDGMSSPDVEDVEQDLKLHLSQVLERYAVHPGKLEHLIQKTLRRKVLNLSRDRHADKRDPRRTNSLNVEIASADEVNPMTLVETPAEGDDSLRVTRTTAGDLCDLKIDLEKAIADLDPRLQKICHLLKTYTPTEAAARLGICPGTLHHHMGVIRQKFEKAGLQVYL